LLQRLPEVADEVNITESPLQNVSGPLAEMVGIVGSGFTTTTAKVELLLKQVPSDTLTE
jgi:signal recognition particle GTPase